MIHQQHRNKPENCGCCYLHAKKRVPIHLIFPGAVWAYIDKHIEEYTKRHDGAISRFVRRELQRDMDR